jgi:hypothetical protein
VLTFYDEEKDSFRDIVLRKSYDVKEMKQYTKIVSEFITMVLHLREQYITENKVIKKANFLEGFKLDLQLSTAVFNKLQVMSLPLTAKKGNFNEKMTIPLVRDSVMGCQPPLSEEKMKSLDESSMLQNYVVDQDYEVSCFNKLIVKLQDDSRNPINLVSAQEGKNDFEKNQNESIISLLREICANCNFYRLRVDDESQLKAFASALIQTIKMYEALEYKISADLSFEMLDAELDTATENESDQSLIQDNTKHLDYKQTMTHPTVPDEDIDPYEVNSSESDEYNSPLQGNSRNFDSSFPLESLKIKFEEYTERMSLMLTVF